MSVYRCHRKDSKLPGLRHGSSYEMLCVATHVSTLQELVAYRGLDGLDSGKFFLATLSQWQDSFERVVLVVESKPETAINLCTEGNPGAST